MVVYQFIQDSDAYNYLDNRGDWAALERGKPLARSWRPPRVGVDEHAGRWPDFPSLLLSIPVFSARAWETLRPLVGASVEALPLDCPAGPSYFAINVLDHVEALDHDRSEVERFDDGRVMAVDFYAFKPGLLRGKHVFKLPETARIEVLVSNDFKELVEKHCLTGLIFKELGSAS